MNTSTRFEINPKSVYTSLDEEFDEKFVSTGRKKLPPLRGISAKISENGLKEQDHCSSLKIGLHLIS